LGVLAVDALSAGGGRLATLSQESIAALDRVLPQTWSRANPVDIIGDAPGSRYRAALEILLKAPDIDAVLALHAPTATVDAADAARAVIAAAGQKRRRPVRTAWGGEHAVAPARDLFEDAGIASYNSPGQAVRAFLAMVRYRRNQEMLIETPPTLPTSFTPDRAAARRVIERALAEAKADVMLGEADAKTLLAAYGIPVVETRMVADADQAAAAAAAIDFPVALKVQSPDISHKSDVGGVQLHLASADEVVAAARAMVARVAELAPDARMSGFTVQSMALRPGAHELIVGLATDPIFGPVILFGEGGTAVEVIGDRAVALPPLNPSLAHEQMKRTRIYRLLEGYRDRPAADLDAVKLTLLQVSQIAIDLPEVVELDINPLLADAGGVVALDARIRLTATPEPEVTRLAIRAYPEELEETVRLRNGDEVLIRPIRPEDEPAHYDLLSRLSPEDTYFRFFGHIGRLPHQQMARFTQIDYAREMAFIAARPANPEAGRPTSETLGVVRAIADADNRLAEFAIVVRSDMKRQGLGSMLMDKIVAYCRSRGTARLFGSILRDNRGMLALADAFGFRHRPSTGKVVEVELPL
jgi:acetyltransferase